ncbi:hypothetical protein BSK59_13445 [Paenibacillus odorifer]|uniref:3D domain-containing protein n=1 Tax=Paenibacillus odorifer TaxID=189426 RepID=UPI00096F9148|nr:3D domain-containing protein [Paenibacillus odorifer]OME55477.1 hypothetical protein BSK59_13445 [Paenibacillus odorifer]
MLEVILSLMFTVAMMQSNLQSELPSREVKNTTAIENKVVQTVKVETEVLKPLSSEQLGETKQEEEKWIVFTKVTAYTNGCESTGKTKGDKEYGITSSGKRTKEGRTIAADTKLFPYGTILYIEGVGERVVEDTGGAIKGYKLDVFFEDLDEARDFGRKKNVKVKVIKMGEKKKK